MYKLIWENSKLISNSSNYLQLNSLFSTLEECITSIHKSWVHDFFSETILYTSSVNFWDDLNGCQLWTATWVIIDNIEYELSIEIDSINADYIDWVLKIEWDWVWTSTGTFKLIN